MEKSNENKLALVTEKDLSLVGKNSLNAKQLSLILKKTPKQYVKQRPAKGGGTWDYVTGGYVKKCLNIMFGWDWSFEILNEHLLIESGEVVVKGKLTCRSNGHTIVKTQYGNKDIMFKRGTKQPLSIGNDMKAAATDCLKKCASEIGIAADIYNKEDFREVKIDENDYSLEALQSLYDGLDSELLSPDDALNIERIIDQKEDKSYRKAIQLIQKTINNE